jgi:penicillin-binding protein 1C
MSEAHQASARPLRMNGAIGSIAPRRSGGFIVRKWALRLALASGAACLGVAAILAIAMQVMGPAPIARGDQLSVTVVDRHGQLLRAFTTSEGRWRLPVEPHEVDQRYLAMLMAFEDRRFRSHAGADPIAFARAGYQFLRHRRLVSGGSTLTMQVARLLEGEHEKTASGKFRQIVRALQLEMALSKDEILRLYLRLAPFGGNLEGVRAASIAYFGKEPRRLSVGEAALLVALPQAPGLRRPDRFADAARKARDRVLARAVEAGVVTGAEAQRAVREAVSRTRAEFPKLAAHLAEAEIARSPKVTAHRLTVDRDIQAALESLARTHARGLGERLSAAILAVDHRTGEVIAHVGSSDYFDERRLGAIDMTAAIRSPGSTLKPFIYGLGFDGGLVHPETLIEDKPARFGAYNPRNFDDDFHGTVTIRESLAQSLNIPAVKVLNSLGPGRLVARFRRAGVTPVLPGDGEPTLAIALGGLGMRLADLAHLYAALARGGEAVALTHVARHATPDPRGLPPRPRLLSSVAAWYVSDILKDAPPPASAIGGRIAYKTGTSYGYRDAWAVGYDGRHTIAVWVGRADGTSTAGLTGRAAAAPILFDAFQRISPQRTPLTAAPAGALRSSGAGLPQPLKRFAETAEERSTGGFLDPPVAIAFPPDRSEVEVAGDDVPVVLKAEGGALPLTWLVDGAPIPDTKGARVIEWQPDGRGFVRLSVIDAKGRADRVTVRLR